MRAEFPYEQGSQKGQAAVKITELLIQYRADPANNLPLYLKVIIKQRYLLCYLKYPQKIKSQDKKKIISIRRYSYCLTTLQFPRLMRCQRVSFLPLQSFSAQFQFQVLCSITEMQSPEQIVSLYLKCLCCYVSFLINTETCGSISVGLVHCKSPSGVKQA